ncbi:MAG: hypothetical protein R3D55_04180 [Chloroflexota bacterium]
MMKKLSLLFVLFLLFGAMACGSAEEAGGADTAVSPPTPNDTAAEASTADSAADVPPEITIETQPEAAAAAVEGETVRLNEAYADALPVMSQLAVGTIQLENTALALDEAQAAALLPLWQVVQSLNSSDTAASAEITAVLNQIQAGMSAAQVAEIANMTLTEASLTALLESGAITFGRGAGQGRGQDGSSGTTASGGMPGQGGGAGRGGGLGGGSSLTEEEMATRQAQFASGEGVAGIQDEALVGAVVRLLQVKTGERAESLQGGAYDVLLTAVAETINLSVEEIQAQLNQGTTLAAVIAANGGEVTAVHDAALAALSQLPNAADLDLEQFLSNWLSE